MGELRRHCKHTLKCFNNNMLVNCSTPGLRTSKTIPVRKQSSKVQRKIFAKDTWSILRYLRVVSEITAPVARPLGAQAQCHRRNSDGIPSFTLCGRNRLHWKVR